MKPRKMQMRHAGLVGDFLATARTLDLKAEQKTKLADIDKQVMAMPADAKKAFGDFHDAVVAGIKAGKIDKTKLDPLYAQFDKVTAEHQKKQADALNSLYALLEPAQRKTLVAAMQKQQAAREARWAAKKKGMAANKMKARDWQQQWAKRRLDRMTKMLDLDADQQKKIEPLLTKEKKPAGTKQDRWTAKKKQMEAVLAAFDKDGFDATKLDLGGMGAKDRRAHLDQRVQLLNAMLPILKPEQRTKFADMMPAMRGPHMMGRHGMHPGMMRGHGMRGPGMMRGHGMGMGPAMGPGYRWGGPPIQLPFDQDQSAGQPAAPSAPAAPAAK